MARASFPPFTPARRVFDRRLVAAPRLTAVGRAVYRKSKSGLTCAPNATGEARNSGSGVASSAFVRCAAKAKAASDAMAGAPRIYLAYMISGDRRREQLRHGPSLT